MSTVLWATTVALDAAFALLVAVSLAAAAPVGGSGLQLNSLAGLRLAPLGRVFASIAFCAAVVDIVLRSLAMADAPLSAMPALLPAVLVHSRIGHLWVIEALAIAVVWAMSGRRQWAAWMALFCWAASRSAVSHAAAEGDVWPIAVQLLHLLAMGAWAGSVWLAASELWWPAGDAAPVRAERNAAAHRLSTLATWALATVVVTGMLSASRHVGSVAALTASDAYAAWLRIKLACVAVAALLGALNRWHTLPPLLAGWRDGDPGVMRWERRFCWLARIESLALLAAIAIAAKLASTEPPNGSL